MVEINNPNEEWIRKEYLLDDNIRTLPLEFSIKEQKNYVEILEQLIGEQKQW